MAEIVKAGAFATEGERRAAGELANLPADWIVICNKVLPTSNGRTFEIDFIVIGKRHVFLIDEKSWYGQIRGSDQIWVRADGASVASWPNTYAYEFRRSVTNADILYVPGYSSPSVSAFRRLRIRALTRNFLSSAPSVPV